jgi:hypothetical protein
MAEAEKAKEPCKTTIMAGGTCPDCGWGGADSKTNKEPHSVALHGSHFMQAEEVAAAKSEKEEVAALRAENADLKAKLAMSVKAPKEMRDYKGD